MWWEVKQAIFVSTHCLFMLNRKGFATEENEKSQFQFFQEPMTKQLIESFLNKLSCEFNSFCPWLDISRSTQCRCHLWTKSSKSRIYYLASRKLRKLLIDCLISQCQSFQWTTTANVVQASATSVVLAVTVRRMFRLRVSMLKKPFLRRFPTVCEIKSIDLRAPEQQWIGFFITFNDCFKRATR